MDKNKITTVQDFLKTKKYQEKLDRVKKKANVFGEKKDKKEKEKPKKIDEANHGGA